jgi:hypothetical protein
MSRGYRGVVIVSLYGALSTLASKRFRGSERFSLFILMHTKAILKRVVLFDEVEFVSSIVVWALLLTAPAGCTSVFSSGSIESPPSEGLRIHLDASTVPAVSVVASNSADGALFVLDTGSWYSLVSTKLVSRWSLRKREIEQSRFLGSSGEVDASYCVRFPVLEIGSMNAYWVDAIVADLPDKILGIIGRSLFNDEAVIIDSQNGVVTIVDPDDLDDLLSHSYSGDVWSKLRLEEVHGDLVATLKLGDVDVRMLVDTGSTTTLLSRSIVRQRGKDIGQISASRTGVVENNVLDVHAFSVSDLLLGAWRFNIETVDVDDALIRDRGVDGKLGWDVLCQQPVILMGSRRELWVMNPRLGQDAHRETVLRASNAE